MPELELQLPPDLDTTMTLMEPIPSGQYKAVVEAVELRAERYEDEYTGEVEDPARQYLIWTVTVPSEEDATVRHFTDWWLSDGAKQRAFARYVSRLKEEKPSLDETTVEMPQGIRNPILSTFEFLTALGLMEKRRRGKEGRRATWEFVPIGFDLSDLAMVVTQHTIGREFLATIDVVERRGRPWNQLVKAEPLHR